MARHRPLRALFLGLALIAAACAGSDDAVSTEDAASDDATAEEAPAAENADDAPADESDASTDDQSASDDQTDETDPADPAGGEEPSAPASGPPPSLPPEEAQAAAEQNIPDLQLADDVRDVEVVSVYDGSITSLREVVTGDRPVLLWFWAPH